MKRNPFVRVPDRLAEQIRSSLSSGSVRRKAGVSDNRYGCTTEKRLLSCRTTPLPRFVLRPASEDDLKIGNEACRREGKRDTLGPLSCTEILFSPGDDQPQGNLNRSAKRV